MKQLPFALSFVAALASGTAAHADSASPDQLARGAYLARITDCGGCHTPRDAQGVPIEAAALSGGTIGFEIPGLATFWPPNLTQDATGLAGWSQEQIVAAIRTGVRPDGRILAPVMPWGSFSAMTDEDAEALAAYLLSLPGVANKVPAPLPPDGAATMPFYRVTLP